ncbi:MAG TPA: hypothetical protein VGI97_09290 [Gemmatimonadaceae bacterium]|jgi:hypothetical protein
MTAPESALPALADDRLARVAIAIEPVLNRVVLAGPPALELLLNDSTERHLRLNFAADSVFQLLSTSMVDRLGLDLQRAGFTRVGRTSHADRWHGAELTLELIQVQTDGTTPRQLCLEYATLLTHAIPVGPQLTIRSAVAPALLALECTSFIESGTPVLESEELERVVLLIAGRAEIEKECAAAPAELRAIIMESLSALVATDALHLLVRRALPDTAMLPALAKRVRDRIVRMAC